MIGSFSRPSSRAGRCLLTGSALLVGSTAGITVGNYAMALFLGRRLGPAAYADVSLSVSVMLTIAVMAAAYGQVAARFTALYTAAGDLGRVAALRVWLRRGAWAAGLVLLALLVGAAPSLMRLFHTRSPWPFVLVGLGLPIFLIQGVERGVLQGRARFGTLTLSYQAEMAGRLLATLGLVSLGWGAAGAIAALPLSFVASWLVTRRAGVGLPRATAEAPLTATERGPMVRFAGPVSAALLGQALLANDDLLIVRHAFAAGPAGRYAALALAGRLITAVTWSVSTALFPLAARTAERDAAPGRLFAGALGLVAMLTLPVVAAAFLWPRLALDLLVGPAYLAVAPLLGPSVLAATLYAFARIAIAYRLSAGRGGGSLLALLGATAQAVALCAWHATLAQVVLVQLGLMAALCGTTLLLAMSGRRGWRRAWARNVCGTGGAAHRTWICRLAAAWGAASR